MAKQSKTVITKREKQLQEMGFRKMDDGGFIHDASTTLVLPDQVEKYNADEWDGIIEQLPSLMERTDNAAPATDSASTEQTNADNAMGTDHTKHNADSDIAKFDMNEQTLQVWKQQYAGLAIASLTDKENIKKVKEAKSFIRKVRTTLEAKRKSLKEWYLAEGKKIDDVAKKYNAIIEEIETPLTNELDKLETWETEAEQKKAAEEATELNRRVDMLKASGLQYADGYYTLGAIFMTIDAIKVMPEADLNSLNDRVKEEKARLDAEAETARKEREAREEADRVERENFQTKQREQAKKEQEIKDKEKEIEEKAEALRRQMITMRENMCKGIGLSFVAGMPGYHFKNDFTEISLTMEALKDSADDAFQALINTYSESIVSGKQKQALKDEADRVERERIQAENAAKEAKAKLEFEERQNDLINKGMRVYLNDYFLKNDFGDIVKIPVQQIIDSNHDNWPALMEDIAEQIHAFNTKTDEKRAAAALEIENRKPDIQRTREYMLQIIASNPPAIKDKNIKPILDAFVHEVEQAQIKASQAIDKFEV